MSAPVANRPYGRLDSLDRVIPSSFGNMAYQAGLNGSSQLAYIGFARPGSDVDDPVWQIFYIQYSSGLPTSITWPQDTNGAASNDYIFVFSDYASYTYS